eukprot:scaffold24450_cov22-Tisochrysis_lutea.AAC.3
MDRKVATKVPIERETKGGVRSFRDAQQGRTQLTTEVDCNKKRGKRLDKRNAPCLMERGASSRQAVYIWADEQPFSP